MTYNAIEFLENLFAPDVQSCRAPTASPMSPVGRPGIGVDDLPGDWRIWFEERAAIKEHDGHLPRELAEAQALTETVEQMRKEKLQVGVDRR